MMRTGAPAVRIFGPVEACVSGFAACGDHRKRPGCVKYEGSGLTWRYTEKGESPMKSGSPFRRPSYQDTADQSAPRCAALRTKRGDVVPPNANFRPPSNHASRAPAWPIAMLIVPCRPIAIPRVSRREANDDRETRQMMKSLQRAHCAASTPLATISPHLGGRLCAAHDEFLSSLQAAIAPERRRSGEGGTCASSFAGACWSISSRACLEPARKCA